MMIYFCCNVLWVIVVVLFSFVFGVQVVDILQVKVIVNDKQCELMQVIVNVGKIQFIIQNYSQKVLEWEILKGVMVVEECENIVLGFIQKFIVNLQLGEYDMICGLFINLKGKLIVIGVVIKDVVKVDVVLSFGDVIIVYKVYVMVEIVQLVSGIKVFIDVVKVGDIEKVKVLYVLMCQYYECIEFIVELFFDFDGSIDVCEDDFEKKVEDLKFIGFYCLEKVLFGDNSVKGMEKYVDQLNSDVLEL